MDGRIVNACIAPLVSSDNGIHARVDQVSCTSNECSWRALAQISFVAVRDGDSGGTVGGGIAVDVRTP